MQKRFNSQRQKQTQYRKKSIDTDQECIQAELLHHKIKALEAKLMQQTTITQTLRFHNEELDRQVIQKNQIINKLKGENAHMKSVITDLEKQLEARKKSAQDMVRQIRQQSSNIKQQNFKMCEIVRYLESQADELKQKNMAFQVTEQGLRKRVEQLVTENDNIRRRMAKSEVESEKYKLKALEGEKYWSSKLQKSKNKENQILIQQKYDIENKHKEEVVRLKADIFRYEKLLNIKQEQIVSLQKKIEEFLRQ